MSPLLLFGVNTSTAPPPIKELKNFQDQQKEKNYFQPLYSEEEYQLNFLESIHKLNTLMRWRAHFFLNPNETKIKKETYAHIETKTSYLTRKVLVLFSFPTSDQRAQELPGITKGVV